MVAVGIDYLRRKEADKALRKLFVTNLNLCPEQAQEYDGNKQKLCRPCAGIFANSEEEERRLDIGTLKEVSDSADQGCALCSLLREAISSISNTHSSPLDKHLLSIDWDNSRITIERCFNGYSERKSHKGLVVHAQLDMFVDRGDPASSIIKGRPNIEDFTSSRTLELIQHWLHECASSEYHATCKRNVDRQWRWLWSGGSETPLRLLNVGIEGDTQITLSQNHKAVDYVALSYCWGGSQDVVLTAKDAEQPLFAFEFSALPVTIQDAIIVTRKLGLTYLWIDSLCIIQKGDNGKDFAIQGPKMDVIYGSAFITVAAANTSNVRGGILNYCKSQKGRDSIVNLPYDLGCGRSGNIMISARNRTREYKAEPLLSRCWTLQERILSQRVLSFHKNHLTWNCRNSHQSSDGLSWPNTDLSYLLPSIIPQELFTSTKKPTTKIPKFWRLCVEDYSNRFRTLETDKLTAIAGVARRIHKQTGDVYLAGLWKSDIMMQLCWSTADERSQRSTRPSCYLAPSWSWASLNSKVEFFDPVDMKWCWMTHLVDVKTSLLRKSNPFSEVTDGRLALRGPVKKARTTDEHGNLISKSFPNENVRRAAKSENVVSGQSCLSSIMDGGQVVDEKEFREFYWLWMFSDHSRAFLLLLKATGEEAIFTRTGSIELKVGGVEFKWFDDATVQNVTIV